MIIEVAFILSVGLIIYAYAGYPTLMFILSRFLIRPIRSRDITPRVSVIIAAHNEEYDIEKKLKNTLSLDYPADKLEIIIASDCSTDGTDEIVRRYGAKGVILYRHPIRCGKTLVQRQATRLASGEILVFSDATTTYQRDALRRIVRPFADPAVGCVAGQLIYQDSTQSSVGRGCRSYWSYEKFLKQCESRIGSLIGVSGCLYAIRQNCFADIPDDLIEDFAVATEVKRQGFRTVYEPEAISIEETNQHSTDEFRMRVRIIVQTLRVLSHYRSVLNPLKYGLFACQMLSHKVLRYAVPFFLLIAFVSALLLRNQSVLYWWACFVQIGFYLLALLAWCGERLKVRLGPLAIPFFFILVNLATIIALLKFIKGDTQSRWEPVRRQQTSQT